MATQAKVEKPCLEHHHNLPLHMYLCGYLFTVSPADSNLPGGQEYVCLIHPDSQAGTSVQ